MSVVALVLIQTNSEDSVAAKLVWPMMWLEMRLT
jgi:hypothetical protein